ncbi:MAG: glutamine-hydrolyzing carbamoyl-phosphate synthase small subunit [Bacteroidetes bacterium]|nr:glutamine-hydrolyzing carbamoyl-phosphate synthase small subunit [Bacteroidota bacterium]HET6245821.1 glutamine-hydrolyzing carbamoyl-phosphate synthase small subunit [Bacteroidia bacterium]
MKFTEKVPAVLVLEDGKIFHGKSAGKIGTTTGEICFNTGMTGYQEIFTDPSYFGQIIIMTNVHIGNYGVLDDEAESGSIKIAGMVCKIFNEGYSRVRAEKSLQNYFVEGNVVGISDIDTRALVRYIRNKGTMNAIISSEETDIEILKNKLSQVPSMKGLELSSKVTTKEPYNWGSQEGKYKVAVLDLGVKYNSLRNLEERGCTIKVFPMSTSVEEMLAWSPDGFLISNGPGDPEVMPDTVQKVVEIVKKDYPLFGICLGHQILAWASGLSTFKMHNGHRGINHPIKNTITGKGEITSQNHGFCVSKEDAENSDQVELTHYHLNDGTLAGFRVKNKRAFSVQYHPEAGPGPLDSRYLFDMFIDQMLEFKAAKKLESEVL